MPLAAWRARRPVTRSDRGDAQPPIGGRGLGIAAARRQAGHRQSCCPPSSTFAGTGSCAASPLHQQFSDRSQPNTAPHRGQAGRRAMPPGEGEAVGSVMSRIAALADLSCFDGRPSHRTDPRAAVGCGRAPSKSGRHVKRTPTLRGPQEGPSQTRGRGGVTTPPRRQDIAPAGIPSSSSGSGASGG